MTETIDIVMATYNGELYICEQLDSIIAQTYENWRLLISDDGSSDSTIEILNRYSKNDNRIVIVNAERQGGVVENFNKGLSFSASDYILLCDQDDVWLPNKIEKILHFIQEQEALHCKNLPILAFSDRTIVDKDLNIISTSAFKYQGIPPELNCLKSFLMWRSTIYGCTTIFNRALLKIAMPIPLGVPMHDQWLGLVATKHGKVFIYNKSTILYRIHDTNVVGGKKRSFLKKGIAFRKLFKEIYSASKKIKFQYYAIGGTKKLNLLNRYRFVKKFVLPHSKYSKIYCLTFIFIFIFSGNNKYQLDNINLAETHNDIH